MNQSGIAGGVRHISRVAGGWLAWMLALLVVLGVGWRLLVLQQGPAVGPAGVAEDAALFDAALAHGLLVAEADGSLTPLPSDELLARRQRGEAVDEQTTEWFRRLQHSPAGRAVRGELRRWNQSRALSALRDNSAQFAGLRHSGWRAFACDAAGEAAAVERPLGEVVPESYGFLHQGRLRAGMGAWQVAAGPGCTEFRTRFFAPRPQTLKLWLIGQPQSLFRRGSRSQGKGVEVVAPQRAVDAPPCGPAVSPQAAIQTVPAASWTRVADGWERELRVRLDAVAHRDVRVAGLKVGIDPSTCQHAWLQPDGGQSGRSAGRRLRAQRYALYSADGVPLLDELGGPTTEAREIGLLPLVGYGRQDHNSLSGLLARSRLPSGGFALHLTLDTAYQRIAQQVLAEGVAAQHAPASDRYLDQRRAVLVVLDADSGAIVAAAGLPAVPEQGEFQDWDYAAFARAYPTADPLRVRAWDTALDRHDVPGSTFKPVSALAALAAARDDAATAQMLDGWGPRQFVRETGLALSTTSFDPYKAVAAGSPDGRSRRLRNFMTARGQRESFNTLLSRDAVRSADCPLDADDPAPPNHRLGLDKAVRDSLNVWFASLAMRVDGAAMDRLDRPELASGSLDDELADTHFSATLRRLGFADRLDLIGDAPPGISQWARPQLPAASVSLWREKSRTYRWKLAQNAIGQGVSVAPLHMARVAASIAAGRVVAPHLVAQWNDVAVEPAPGEALPGEVGQLRSAMRSVPQVGTAKKAFATVFAEQLDSSLRCDSYGKTGTAQVAAIGEAAGGVEPFNSAWFVGWHRGDSLRPLAFACMVSHAYGRGSSTGGQVCAPIVARFLQQVAALPAPAAPGGSKAPEVLVEMLPASAQEAQQ